MSRRDHPEVGRAKFQQPPIAKTVLAKPPARFDDLMKNDEK
jgi:hypothetical protein